MKKLLSITTIAILLTVLSCKKETYKSMTVIKDCTGTYLRTEGKDFKVCNLEKLSSISEGSQVTATFKKIENCPSLEDKFVCLMYHENEGWIKIVDLK
jgi:hypothetical protein